MNPSTANEVINGYAAFNGYPTVAQINLMERKDFMKGLENWPTEYIAAMPDAGLNYNLSGKVKHPQTGQVVRSEWGWKMEQVKKVVEFRNTTEGKKSVLRHLVSDAIRNEDTDINDMLNTATIKVAATTGSKKRDKKQTQINIERMNHIRALEKSISKGGALRVMYD
ncbi:MAG: hypothetical protein ACK5LL_06395, partial [Suipraeoptans sp.]